MADLITAAASVVLCITAVISAVFALVTWRKQVREQKGRWLAELSARFASDRRFQRVRRDLYAGLESKTVAAVLRRTATTSTSGTSPSATIDETDYLVAFDDYVGFFELIGHLVEAKEMAAPEANRIFGWYVGQLLKDDRLRTELADSFFPVIKLGRTIGYQRAAAKGLKERNRLLYDYRLRTSRADARFLCECAKRDCKETITLPLETYSRLRSSGVFARGHNPTNDDSSQELLRPTWPS